ncbi:hypothetical protein [Streptomyces olivaceiscleroticus]|uniref:Uncharacterized protein n=1 Tax=Streptomyces olivaceiscleroticus TaxID=68245 RepID=A0ABP3LI32_9ACTN
MATPETEHRPDYPPKTPPPPKKPPSPFPPEPVPKTIARTDSRIAARIANRRCANWTLEAQPWTPAGATRRVVQQLTTWGYRPDDTVGAIVRELTTTAVQAGGRRISIHLADQHRQVLVLVLAHQPVAEADESALHRIAELGVASCGTDHGPDGLRVWAVIDL